VHISVTFTDDLERADYLAKTWEDVAPVKIGGPATGEAGGQFEPGVYLKPGYVITSRGCPNRCWFCSVWKREGQEIREHEIRPGWNILDDNLLACSRPHIESVFEMLKRQKQSPEFTGGLEAAKLKWWHVAALRRLNPSQMFFAYDTLDDLEPLQDAGQMLHYANFTRRHLRCYVLIGGPKDKIPAAEYRLMSAWDAGFMPMAMLWMDPKTERTAGEQKVWETFQREWARVPIIKATIQKELDKLAETS